VAGVARAALRLLARLVDAIDSTGATGLVLNQLPAAGTEWLTGRAVAIAVAAGPDDGTGVEVPELVGRTLQDAMSMLEEAGLGSEGFVTNPNVVLPTIPDRLPRSGVLVRPATTVLLLADEQQIGTTGRSNPLTTVPLGRQLCFWVWLSSRLRISLF